MGAVKNHYHDEICAREPQDEPDVCEACTHALAVADGLCRDCWNDINGQFGVGA